MKLTIPLKITRSCRVRVNKKTFVSTRVRLVRRLLIPLKIGLKAVFSLRVK